ncbi:MAG: helix-turn-helix domain-containing protein [Brevefilum sp.]|nr:helix-turn-helix domain-containing protein [Brevefilum sp.]MDT8382602.1 helix-turn-helix domain-containing protein [Brevefilum sp.]MDW7754772.1 helix-turn-helix domain-containing protein [Brevefilum sp.]
MATLGQKLRELRHQKGYKLNEVAAGADLSISFISLIERDRASISVENLQKLANFYNVRLFQIFQDIEEEDAYVVRDEQVKAWHEISSANKLALILRSPEDNLSFKAIQAVIPPASVHESFKVQKGETFILVREGQVEVTIPNKSPVQLNQGDSAHLTSFKGTLIKNVNESLPAKLLIVASATTESLDKQGNLLTYDELTE